MLVASTDLSHYFDAERAIEAIGWPGRAKVGDEGAGAAFMILQHAISKPDLQRRGLALILEAIPEGQANALDAAYLSDRIAVFEGREQTFGTQFDWDPDGLLSPAPIRDPAYHVAAGDTITIDVPEAVAKQNHIKLDQAAPIATVDELPDYDAIIIGAGHNGLVAAAYLDDARLAREQLREREQPTSSSSVETPSALVTPG